MRILVLLSTVLIFFQADAGYYYVNSTTGNDTLDGTSDTFVSGNTGPKKTIKAMMGVAGYLDTIQIANGFYPETVVVTQSYYFRSGDSVAIKYLEMKGSLENLHLIAGSIHVTDSLVFTDGLIYPDSGKLIASSNCRMYGGNKTSFVSGDFIIENDLFVGSAKYFPIGDVDTYRPVYLSFNQSTLDTNRYLAQFFRDTAPAGTIPPTLKYISQKNHWFFRYTGPSFADHFQGLFSYDTTGNNDEVSDPVNLRIAQRDEYGSSYIDLGGSGNGPKSGTISNSGTVDSLGYYVLANAYGGSNSLGNNNPIALFSYSNPCEESLVNFTDESSTATAPINRWYWYFGTGDSADTSNVQNPAFVFDSAGMYKVTLAIADSSGFRDTYSTVVEVFNRPMAAYTATSVCANDSTFFMDMSSLDSGEVVVSRLWTLNTGVFHYDDTMFKYRYPSGGTYNTSLILYTAKNCTDTAFRSVQVFAKPAPSFTVAGVCFGNSTAFFGNGGKPGDTVVSWKWFVDGSIQSTFRNWKALQDTAKTFDLMLAIISQNNCYDTSRGNFTVYENPIASFALDKTVTPNDSMQCFKGNDFTLLSYSYFPPAQASNVNLYWGASRTPGGNTFNFTSSGVHPVELVITTDKGCADSSIKFYKVFDKITVGYNVFPGCIPLPTKFKSTSTAGAASINNYRWKFGDGTVTNLSIDSANYNYAVATLYDVQLTVTTSDGCVDSVSKFITVDKTPVITFTNVGSNPFCEGDSLKVTANGGAAVVWDDAVIVRNRTFFFSTKRKVTAYSAGGTCTATDSVTVVMNPSPLANAGKDTLFIKGKPLILLGSGGSSYRWEPAANASTPNNASTQIDISAPTAFILRVTDANGCVDYDTLMVAYQVNYLSKIPNLITPNNDNLNDNWDLSDVPNIQSSGIKVFSSFGKMVWNLNSGYTNNWKGTATDGSDLPNGTYLYIIENTSDPKIFKGYLQILR